MPEISSSRWTVTCDWTQVPHLDERTQKEILDSTPDHLKEARSAGVPTIGAGAIYPIPLRNILCDPFLIPDYWPRGYALDVGWKKTAALWGAFDRNSSTLYLYAEYYRGHELPSTHAQAIKARGDWIPGIVDPAAAGASQKDGSRLMQEYVNDYGLKLTPAVNHVEAGIDMTWRRLSAGKIKVFRTLENFQNEYRFYRRDKHGAVVKEADHTLDCMRYLVLSNYSFFQVRPVASADLGPADVGDSMVAY